MSTAQRIAQLEARQPRKRDAEPGLTTKQLVVKLCAVFGVDGTGIAETPEEAAAKGFTCIADEVEHAIASKLGCDPREVRDLLKESAKSAARR